MLRNRPSFFIGTYIILASLLINTIISGFTTEASPFGFLTVNYLELFIFSITLLGTIFSLLALFFGNRKYLRKIGYKVWNKNSKKMMWLLLSIITLIYIIEFYLLRIGQEIFIIPTFIISYGIILLFLNHSKIVLLYLLSMVCFLIGFIPLFVDDFGFYTLIIFGIAHYTFAFLKREINAL